MSTHELTAKVKKLKELKTFAEDVSLQLRIAQETADKLQECADALSLSRTEVIEQGIDLIHKQVVEKQ